MLDNKGRMFALEKASLIGFSIGADFGVSSPSICVGSSQSNHDQTHSIHEHWKQRISLTIILTVMLQVVARETDKDAR